ncbi:HupE/UreJ family protein [Pseudanabaenaceae cyanobacterium LEGE 13415]|nr:HupE/UreJ family protein [Pseudanabaenaceae cyanobacterium LEGE 13415]
MNLLKFSKSILITIALMSIASPAFAHHAMGGRMPSNFIEGFLTGIAHPIIGLDHFAFIIAIGLLAAMKTQGIWIPIAFVLSAMLGTELHVANINVPGVELFVSGSILLFGLLLMKDRLNTAIVIGLAAVAGVFHGYAYGEAIFGAEMTPLLAYLAGFTTIQLAVSLAAYWIGKAIVIRRSTVNQFRSAGLVIFGIGLAFFVSQVVNLLFPLQSA